MKSFCRWKLNDISPVPGNEFQLANFRIEPVQLPGYNVDVMYRHKKVMNFLQDIKGTDSDGKTKIKYAKLIACKNISIFIKGPGREISGTEIGRIMVAKLHYSSKAFNIFK